MGRLGAVFGGLWNRRGNILERIGRREGREVGDARNACVPEGIEWCLPLGALLGVLFGPLRT
eukprot:6131464-Pyramimonas_sp.AAC.1